MYGLLFDATLCIGCEACLDACKEEYQLPESDRDRLSQTDFTILEEQGDNYLRRFCMHCLEPSCASACPVGALKKSEMGPVTYDFDRCIGCRYCMVACPYHVPRYTWDKLVPQVKKCEMCKQRTLNGQQTACAEACEEDATIYGKRVDLIAEAWRRISESPDDYAQRVYGLEEVGGTCVLVIGPEEVLNAAFDERLPHEALPHKTWVVLSQIPTAVAVAGAGLVGVNWIIRRRMALSQGNDNGNHDSSHGIDSTGHEGEKE